MIEYDRTGNILLLLPRSNVRKNVWESIKDTPSEQMRVRFNRINELTFISLQT